MREHAADLLEKAKCYGAAVGLESGNQEIREVVIRKQSKNEHIVEGARLLRAKGIKVLTTNMVGLPGETLDNALETVELNMVLKSNYVRANTFLLFPGLPLVEYAKQNGYLDKDFDIEKHVAEATEITIKTPYDARVQQHRRAVLVAGQVSAALDSVLQEGGVAARQHACSASSARSTWSQELLFYRVRPIPALRYFRNTVLMTHKSQLSMTMRMWPSLFKRKAEAPAVPPKQIFEASRGYF